MQDYVTGRLVEVGQKHEKTKCFTMDDRMLNYSEKNLLALF